MDWLTSAFQSVKDISLGSLTNMTTPLSEPQHETNNKYKELETHSTQDDAFKVTPSTSTSIAGNVSETEQKEMDQESNASDKQENNHHATHTSAHKRKRKHKQSHLHRAHSDPITQDQAHKRRKTSEIYAMPLLLPLSSSTMPASPSISLECKTTREKPLKLAERRAFSASNMIANTNTHNHVHPNAGPDQTLQTMYKNDPPLKQYTAQTNGVKVDTYLLHKTESTSSHKIPEPTVFGYTEIVYNKQDNTSCSTTKTPESIPIVVFKCGLLSFLCIVCRQPCHDYAPYCKTHALSMAQIEIKQSTLGPKAGMGLFAKLNQQATQLTKTKGNSKSKKTTLGKIRNVFQRKKLHRDAKQKQSSKQTPVSKPIVFHEGDVVVPYMGEYITYDEMKRRYYFCDVSATTGATPLSVKEKPKSKKNKKKKNIKNTRDSDHDENILSSHCVIQYASNPEVYIDASRLSCAAAMVNCHFNKDDGDNSNTNNTCFHKAMYAPLGIEMLCVVALRDIYDGEEIFTDYGTDYDYSFSVQCKRHRTHTYTRLDFPTTTTTLPLE